MGGATVEKTSFKYSELLGQQVARFDQLKSEVGSGHITLQSLSLGIDRKNGNAKTSECFNYWRYCWSR